MQLKKRSGRDAKAGGRAVAIGLLLILAAAGCGAGDDGVGVATVGGDAASASPTPSPMTDDERRVKFAQCMREQGVELPDPETEDGGRVAIRAPEGAPPKGVEAAMEKCRQYLPNGGDRPRPNPEQIEQVRRMAQCMRENGVPEFPDPDPEGGIRLRASPDSRLNPNDPTFKAAQEACKQYRPTGAPRTGSGGNR
jgi:hypothetical protein